MNDSPEVLQRKLKQAGDLGSVVKTMKAIAASNISQYLRAVASLDEYYQTILLAVQVYLRHHPFPTKLSVDTRDPLFIVLGSDQGLVGPFNHNLTVFTNQTIVQSEGRSTIWAVGERVEYLLRDAGLNVTKVYQVPGSIQAVNTLTTQLILDVEKQQRLNKLSSVFTLYNRPGKLEGYAPVFRKLLPFEQEWIRRTKNQNWPTNKIPEILGAPEKLFSGLFREYLYTSIYRSCVHSLASENRSRLNAMIRAEKNIGEVIEQLQADFHQLRQDTIDAELFDIIAGFKAARS